MSLFSSNKDKKKVGEMSFLGHLEALRWHLVRSVIVIFILAGVAFCFPEILFSKIILAPKSPDFLTYQLLCKLSHQWGMGAALCFTEFNFTFQNIEVTGQFTLAMWGSFVAGLVLAFPYLLWEIWRFIRPALKDNEAKAATGFIFGQPYFFLLAFYSDFMWLRPWLFIF